MIRNCIVLCVYFPAIEVITGTMCRILVIETLSFLFAPIKYSHFVSKIDLGKFVFHKPESEEHCVPCNFVFLMTLRSA